MVTNSLNIMNVFLSFKYMNSTKQNDSKLRENMMAPHVRHKLRYDSSEFFNSLFSFNHVFRKNKRIETVNKKGFYVTIIKSGKAYMEMPVKIRTKASNRAT